MTSWSGAGNGAVSLAGEFEAFGLALEPRAAPPHSPTSGAPVSNGWGFVVSSHPIKDCEALVPI